MRMFFILRYTDCRVMFNIPIEHSKHFTNTLHLWNVCQDIFTNFARQRATAEIHGGMHFKYKQEKLFMTFRVLKKKKKELEMTGGPPADLFFM